MLHPRTLIIAGIFGIAALLAAGSTTVSATHVTIDANLSVTPSVISYSTVFPQEVLFRPLEVSLSQSCRRDSSIKEIEYRIVQQPKPRQVEDRDYCRDHPTDLSRCYPSLCPYLSKEPDGSPANDTGVPAFHDPSAESSIAHGTLSKPSNDPDDRWTIDLHVPCFKGECDQTNEVPPQYQPDPSLEGQAFGCDLVVIANKITRTPQELEGSIGFWKNWNRHHTYTESQINGWLADIDSASAWLLNDHNADLGISRTYSINTAGMVQLINDTTGLCQGNLRRCMATKFKAQYLVLRLNVLAGRKPLTQTYNVSAIDQINYLGLGSGNVTLEAIIAAMESKASSVTGTSPTRPQLLIMANVAQYINGHGH